MYSASGYTKGRWVCFFIKTDLDKFSLASLAHQLFLCSEWVPSEFKQLISNITVIHNMTPVHQLMSCEVASSQKCINSFIHNNTSYSAKVVFLHQNPQTYLFITACACKWCLFFAQIQTKKTFSLEKEILWMDDFIFYLKATILN